METEISQALKRDQADIERAAKRTSNQAVENRATPLTRTKFMLDVYDMECPYEAPKSIGMHPVSYTERRSCLVLASLLFAEMFTDNVHFGRYGEPK